MKPSTIFETKIVKWARTGETSGRFVLVGFYSNSIQRVLFFARSKCTNLQSFEAIRVGSNAFVQHILTADLLENATRSKA